MKLKAIVAMDANGGIGLDDKLPWGNEYSDLSHFKKVTMGGVVIMGRKTFESIGCALPGRTNIVISRTMKPIDGVIVVKSIMDLQKSMVQIPHNKAFVIGGAEIYNLLSNYIEEYYVTKHNEVFDCNVFFNMDLLGGKKVFYNMYK